MKRRTILSAVAGITAMLCSCGLPGTTGTSAAAGAGSNSTMSSVLTSSGSSVLGTLLGTLLGNTTNQNTLVGTWTYSGPKVTFKSENILAQLGSSVASNKIESTLGTQLQKLGFQAGKTSLTFDGEGNCQMVRSGKTYAGTYTYDTSTSVMTIQGAFGVASIRPYVSVMGNEMYMLFEADQLLTVVSALASATSATSTLGSLLSNYSGLQLGWTMTRTK